MKLILFSLLGIFSFYFTYGQDSFLVVPGQSFGNLEINKSSIQDIENIFGKDYKLKKKIYTEHFVGKGYLEVTRYDLTYKKKGLSFTLLKREDEAKEVLNTVIISSPVKAYTSKGIVLGKSTFQDVVSAYGKADWSYSNENKRVSKIYDGIIFGSSIKEKIKHFNHRQFNEKYLNQVVDIFILTVK